MTATQVSYTANFMARSRTHKQVKKEIIHTVIQSIYQRLKAYIEQAQWDFEVVETTPQSRASRQVMLQVSRRLSWRLT